MISKEQLQELFEKAKILIISTGAGMGKDSGLPTFRNEGGLWGQIEGEEGRSIFEISNPAYLKENPIKAWEMYALRMKMFAEHEPHQGFYIIQEWIEKYFEDYFVLTSNIDGYFQRAGYDENKIRELHGAMDYLQCSEPSCEEVWLEKIDYNKILDNPTLEVLPKSRCNPEVLARPNIYMFRDDDFIFNRVNEQKKRFEYFLDKHQSKPKIVLEIGSGPHVQSIRMKSRELIKHHQATLIRINPKDFKVREGHFSLAQPALKALKEMNEQLA